MFDLSGRIALVTGAGSSTGGDAGDRAQIGAGIAARLAEQGAVVLVNDVDPVRAEATVARIAGQGGRARATPFDVTDRAAVVAAVADAETAVGPIDICVNNAGNAGTHRLELVPFRELDPGHWHRAIDVNLYGVLNCTKAVIDGMCDRGWGRVITISSGAGVIGMNVGISTYAAGKGGAIAFMRHLAHEVARRGVTANCLALGLMGGREPSPALASRARNIPVGRLGTPDDVGFACVYLASAEASWLTGQTIVLDGGVVNT